jgi:hypothetical protein
VSPVVDTIKRAVLLFFFAKKSIMRQSTAKHGAFTGLRVC